MFRRKRKRRAPLPSNGFEMGYVELDSNEAEPDAAYHAPITSMRFVGDVLRVEVLMVHPAGSSKEFRGYRLYGEDGTLILTSPVRIGMPPTEIQEGDTVSLIIDMVMSHS